MLCCQTQAHWLTSAYQRETKRPAGDLGSVRGVLHYGLGLPHHAFLRGSGLASSDYSAIDIPTLTVVHPSDIPACCCWPHLPVLAEHCYRRSRSFRRCRPTSMGFSSRRRDTLREVLHSLGPGYQGTVPCDCFCRGSFNRFRLPVPRF